MIKADLSDVYRDYIACLNEQDWPKLEQFVHDEVYYNGQRYNLSRLIYPPTLRRYQRHFTAPTERGPVRCLRQHWSLDVIRVPVRTERRSKAGSTN